METAAQKRAATPGKEERERDTARRAPENHRTCDNTAGRKGTTKPERPGARRGQGGRQEGIKDRRSAGTTRRGPTHLQKPNNGNLTGDKESNAKDSGGGNKTSTEGLNRDDRDHEGRDNGTKTGAAKRKKKPRSGTGSSTKDLNGTPDSGNNKLHPTSFQRAGTGTERRRVKEDAENRTDQHEDPDTRQRRDRHGGATRQR